MYFKLEGCNFTNNKGSGSINEFGAAVGVTLFTIFEQRVTAERHDIVNWYVLLTSIHRTNIILL